MDKLVNSWTINNIPAFLFLVLILSLFIRVISCLLRAIENKSSTNSSFRAEFVESFLGIGPDSKKVDYWHAFLLGCLEFSCYPILMATNAWTVIGAWLGFKTLAQWKHWTDYRPAFNRFLICNALVLILSLLIMVRFVKVT